MSVLGSKATERVSIAKVIQDYLEKLWERLCHVFDLNKATQQYPDKKVIEVILYNFKSLNFVKSLDKSYQS